MKPVAEIIEEYPELIKKLGWDATALGRLYSYRVLEGVRTSEKRTYISIDSLRELVLFINARIEARKIEI